MSFLNPTCDMDVNYEGKHKHKSLNFKNPWEPVEQIYKEFKIFKLRYCNHKQFKIWKLSNEQNFTKSF